MSIRYLRVQLTLLSILLTGLAVVRPAQALQMVLPTGQRTNNGAEIVIQRLQPPKGSKLSVLRYGIRLPDGNVEWQSFVAEKTFQGPVPEKNPPKPDANGYVQKKSVPLDTGRVDPLNRKIYKLWILAPTDADPLAGNYIEGIIAKNGKGKGGFLSFRVAPGMANLPSLPLDNLTPAEIEALQKPLPSHLAPALSEHAIDSRTTDNSATNRLEVMLNERDMWKPSRLNQTMTKYGDLFQSKYYQIGNSKYLKWLGQAVAKAKKPWDKTVAAGVKTKTFAVNQAKQLPAGYATFYAAMGVQAAVQCMQKNPSNPVACEDYLKSLTDPVGLMMTGAFMLVANPILSKVGGFSTGATTLRSLPMFAGGLLVGVLVTGAIQYATNPDIDKCIGLIRGPDGKRDLEACDRAYTLFTEENLGDMWMPVFAELALSIGAFVPLQYAWSASGMAEIVSKLPLLRSTPAAFASGIVVSLVFAKIFKVMQNELKIGQHVKESNVRHGFWSPSFYGRGLDQNEPLLYSGWTQLKARNFVDLPQAESGFAHTEACAEAYQRAEAGMAGAGEIMPPPMPAECSVPESTRDFVGVLNRYAELQDKFRTLQLTDTIAAGKAWMRKVNSYHISMNTSYVYYKQLLAAIERERATPNEKIDEFNGFNPMVTGKMQESLDRLVEASKDTQSPYLVPDTAGVWTNVDTHRYMDFIVASMACGPEAENYFVTPPESYVRKAQDFVSDYTGSFFSRHDRIITNASGMEARFYPPRLVQRVAGFDSSVCDQLQYQSLFHPKLGWGLHINGLTPDKYFISSGYFTRSGPKYPDLYKFIIANLRDAVAGEDNFDRWWATNLWPAVEATEKQFRTEYSELLANMFTPEMTNPKYGVCDVSSDMEPSLTKVMGNLSVGSTASCAPAAGHRLAYGVWNNTQDELRTYLGLFIDMDTTLAARRGENAETVRGALQDAANLVLQRFEKEMNSILMSDRSQYKPGTAEQNLLELQQAYRAFISQVNDTHPELQNDPNCGDPNSISIAANLHCRMVHVFGTANQYLGIVSMFDESNNPQTSAIASQSVKSGGK